MLKCENELSVQSAEGKPVWKEERKLSWAWKSQKFDDLGYGKEFYIFSSVQPLSRVWFFVTPWTTAHQASLSSPSSRACSNSCPSSRWCHPTISSSVTPFSSCFQSFPASVSFPMSQFFASGGQNIGASASALGLPMNIQSWFPLGLTSMNSLLYKGLSSVFSSTTVWKYQLFGIQPSLWSSSHIYMWLLEKP